MIKLAVIELSGEITCISSPASTSTVLPDGSFHDGHLYKHIPLSTNDEEFMANMIWDGLDFVSRPLRPGEHWEWTLEGWTFNSANFWESVSQLINRDLGRSSWTQMPDAGLNSVGVELWQAYRAALRSIPRVYANATTLEEITWPIPPL